MPKKVHDKLVKRAKKLGLTGERRRAYIHGPLNRLEKSPKKPKKPK